MKTRNEYKWNFEGICPINGRSDKYQATLTTSLTVIVEDLLAYCEKHSSIPTFQEDWAKALAKRFVGKVTLLCHHRGGVRILSECDGRF